MNALKQLQYLPETKEQIDSFVNAAIDEFLSGDISILDAHLKLKIVNETISRIINDVRIKNLVIEEIENGNTENSRGIITLKGRRTMDYSNDPIWNKIKAELKARETLLKGTKGFDPETGEQVMIEKYSEYIETKLK